VIRVVRLALLLGLVPFLAACGGLSSSKAEELITENKTFNEVPTESFVDGQRASERDPFAAGLRDAGLAEIRKENAGSGLATYKRKVARFTAEGRARAASWKTGNGAECAIPLATRRRIVKTNVANLTGATAEARVTWVFELTDVGRAAAKHDFRWANEPLDAEHAFTATFKKYDDGWRFEGFKSGVL
jgi:hypothetical protein